MIFAAELSKQHFCKGFQDECGFALEDIEQRLIEAARMGKYSIILFQDTYPEIFKHMTTFQEYMLNLGYACVFENVNVKGVKTCTICF